MARPGDLSAQSGAERDLQLLDAECRPLDEAILAGEDALRTGLLNEATRLQAEFMRPGVVLISLADGSQTSLAELHREGDRVY